MYFLRKNVNFDALIAEYFVSFPYHFDCREPRLINIYNVFDIFFTVNCFELTVFPSLLYESKSNNCYF